MEPIERSALSSDDSLHHRIRLVMILIAADRAGLAPIGVLRLHLLAFLTNVLAPVWNMPVMEGKLLKRRGGPFYPALQADLDRLVGSGLVVISGLTHIQDEDQRWRLEGEFRLNYELAAGVVDAVHADPQQSTLLGFVRELALAVSALSSEDLDALVREDATYADPMIDYGNVVDFDEWRHINYSANAACSFDRLLPGGSYGTLGERVHLYVRHLQKRLHGAR